MADIGDTGMEKIIKNNAYLKLNGLLHLVQFHRDKFREYEKAIATLLGEKEEVENYYGVVSDYLSEQHYDCDEMLKRMKIKIADKSLDKYYVGDEIKNFLTEKEIQTAMRVQKDL